LNKLGKVNFQIGEKDLTFNKDLRSSYLFNTKLTDIEKSDFCLLIGVNPKIESPLLNIRLRKQFLSKENFLVYSFGPSVNLTYYSQHLGNDIQTLVKFVEGTHPICRQFAKAKNPLIIVGSSIFERSDANAFYKLISVLAKNTNLVTQD
jgi:NADH dehydrogenase/NADH:ubiquinone oxidoreductase subunit G